MPWMFLFRKWHEELTLCKDKSSAISWVSVPQTSSLRREVDGLTKKWSLCHVQLKSFCFVASLPVVSCNSSRFFQETTPLSVETSTFFEKWALINILSKQHGHCSQKGHLSRILLPPFAEPNFLKQVTFAKHSRSFREPLLKHFNGHPLLNPLQGAFDRSSNIRLWFYPLDDLLLYLTSF